MTLPQLHQRRAELQAWARSCLEAADYHGLRDAAADLEIIAARIEERERLQFVIEPTPHSEVGRPIKSKQYGTLLGYTDCDCAGCVIARAALASGFAACT